jgi:hypothetical protein
VSTTIKVLNESSRSLAQLNTGAAQWRTNHGPRCAIKEEGEIAMIYLPNHYQILDCWFYDNGAGHQELFFRVEVQKARRPRRIKA